MTATFTDFKDLKDFKDRSETRTAEPQAPRSTRKRRVLTSLGGIAVAGVLLTVGMVTTSNADFAKGYVTDQLVERKITFKAAGALTDQERQSDCVVANAGKPLTTAKQAECYANEFIGLHVRTMGKGRTYAELGEVQNGLRPRIAAAQASGDPALPGLQKEMTDLTTQRDQMFKGETLRGMLLTSYGFNVLGEKGAEAATVAYVGAGVVLLLSVAGLVVGLRTRKTGRLAPPEPDYSATTR